MKTRLLLSLLVLAALVMVLVTTRHRVGPVSAPRHILQPADSTKRRPETARTSSRIPALAASISPDAISPIVSDLNSPTGSAAQDVKIVNAVFEAWQTNFPGRGNPVGDNEEITAVLAGDNPLRFAFIAPRHPAINAEGQLCDRWGSPYRLHQLSGSAMEIWSAGPDRKFGTADDVRFTPAGAGNIAR